MEDAEMPPPPPPLPDDALAAILRQLPPRALAECRRVCKAWRAVVDARGLLLQHALPHAVRGIFLTYIDYRRPRFLARPSSEPPRIDGNLTFLPDYRQLRHSHGSILDHCNGLLLLGFCGVFYVVNPATRRWERLPPRMGLLDYVAYLVFDPAVSPHYEVFLIPRVPEKPRAIDPREIPPKTYDVSRLFSSFDDTLVMEDAEEEDELNIEELMQPPPPSSIEEGFFPTKRLPLSLRWKMGEPHDTYGLMEWPPSPCTLHVFSSSTRQWEERSFVRDGEAVGTVKDVRLDSVRSGPWYGPRWRYGVYWQGTLYVHCRGAFVMRLSLKNGKYQVFKTPIDIEESKHGQTHLGRSKNGVYFTALHDYIQLCVWNLDESHGQVEWVLKHHVDLGPYVSHPATHLYYRDRVDGLWILEDDHNDKYDNKMLPKDSSEWDSDEDNILNGEGINAVEEYYAGIDNILGFHPYKEIVFLNQSFTAIAYHLHNSKVQYLGKLHPNDYQTHSAGLYESFPYTPCMIGELGETSQETDPDCRQSMLFANS
ncbi:hypothetical protein ACP70R_013926 [Stipagrostis hirtigluma subsp. patula]